MRNSPPLTEDAKAITMLCAVLRKGGSEVPLSHAEYALLAQWLRHAGLRPADLLRREPAAAAAAATRIERQRLETLLGRGVQLGFAVEEWQRNGIWIVSRSDSDYPARYKKHLRDQAPPLLFGVGERSLLGGGGLAKTGSRNADAAGEAFARRTAEWCARHGMTVFSGGAKGIGQAAMNAATDSGGAAVGVLADSLLKKSLESASRHALAAGRLALVSPYHPLAAFSAASALERNKLIYALADYGLVVSAEHKKGGAWAGAAEELGREFPLPVFVRLGGDAPAGNRKLPELGAIPWPEELDPENFRQQLAALAAQAKPAL